MRRGQSDVAAGVVALQAGKLAEAERGRAAAAHRFRRYTSVAPLATLNLAHVHLRAGDLAAAETALTRVERYAWRTTPVKENENPAEKAIDIQVDQCIDC
jgi:hypothetical protein